jgi:hypothetical protein
MNNMLHTSINIESERIDLESRSGNSGFKSELGFPLREFSPAGRRLLCERRQRNAALDVPRRTYEQAYVCSFLDVECFVAQPLENDIEIGGTIDFIEAARKSRAGDPLLGRAGDLIAAYRPPTVAQLRRWLSRESGSLLVIAYRCPNLAEEGICDREDLLYAIGGNFIWLRLWTDYKRAFTACLRSANPKLDRSSTDDEIWRAMNRVLLEHRLRVRFEPSQIREWL